MSIPKLGDAKGSNANGVQTNGVQTNGVQTNGVQTNGVHTNGVHTNGVMHTESGNSVAQPNGSPADPITAAPTNTPVNEAADEEINGVRFDTLYEQLNYYLADRLNQPFTAESENEWVDVQTEQSSPPSPGPMWQQPVDGPVTWLSGRPMMEWPLPLNVTRSRPLSEPWIEPMNELGEPWQVQPIDPLSDPFTDPSSDPSSNPWSDPISDPSNESWSRESNELASTPMTDMPLNGSLNEQQSEQFHEQLDEVEQLYNLPHGHEQLNQQPTIQRNRELYRDIYERLYSDYYDHHQENRPEDHQRFVDTVDLQYYQHRYPDIYREHPFGQDMMSEEPNIQANEQPSGQPDEQPNGQSNVPLNAPLNEQQSAQPNARPDRQQHAQQQATAVSDGEWNRSSNSMTDDDSPSSWSEEERDRRQGRRRSRRIRAQAVRRANSRLRRECA